MPILSLSKRQKLKYTATTPPTVLALLTDISQAPRAVLALRKASYSAYVISLLVPSQTSVLYDVETLNPTEVSEGAVTGASAGILGGLGGFLSGIQTLSIPGIGPLIAAGPIITSLEGVAVDATAGGIVEALVALGVPDYEAQAYDASVKAGKTLITVHCLDSNQATQVRDILTTAGAIDLSNRN